MRSAAAGSGQQNGGEDHQAFSPGDLARYDCDSANTRWLEFHRKAIAAWKSSKPPSNPRPKTYASTCAQPITRSRRISAQFVDALENQTESDFHVIAVDDGSPDARVEAGIPGASCQEQRSRGWDFYRQENAFVDAARNSAARAGKGDLILFVDSDDVPARNAIERMREAITLSGDDALICASYYFASKKRPFDPLTGEVLVPRTRPAFRSVWIWWADC